MSWKGLERNKLDYILTDLLPVELSELFSFSSFYDFLLKKENHKILNKISIELKKCKSKSNEILFKSNWAALPLKYTILKGRNSLRVMSLINPLSALNIYFFMECYQKEILNIFSEKNSFSIRYPKKSTDLYYKSKKTGTIHYFKLKKSSGKNYIQQTGIYFQIVPFGSLNAFSDSQIWRISNFKFRYYAKLDYKSCFDSIYTHVFKWIIEKNVIDSKNANNSNLFIVIDRILQNINGHSSNGILVGPEFSRMIVEILLQQIDKDIIYNLSINNIEKAKDYNVFRYVDDVFIFANEERCIEQIIETFHHCAKKYLLNLNELKLIKGETPCLPKDWLEKTRVLSDKLKNLFRQVKKVEYDNLPEEEKYLYRDDIISINRLKDEIAVLIKSYSDDRRSIVSYLISTILNNVSKKKNGYTIFEKKHSLSKASVLIDIAMYIYAFYPSFDQTRKIISLISYINSEASFKKDATAKIKLAKIIKRYDFIFNFGNIFDLCDWFPFLHEYKINLYFSTEKILLKKIQKENNPILWANFLLYSQYDQIFFKEILSFIENMLDSKLNNLTTNDIFLKEEFWFILIFHNCPHISNKISTNIYNKINSISPSNNNNNNNNRPSGIAINLIKNYLNMQPKSKESFFNWSGSSNFGQKIMNKTNQRTLFKNYNHNKYKFFASID